MTRQIFYRCSAAVLAIGFLFGFASQQAFTISDLQSFEVQSIKSAYFDKAMEYKDSTLRVVSLSQVVKQFQPEGNMDALLLNCYDDYQGIISLDEVRKYDLRLASSIKLRDEYKPPDWLNPLLIVVPDGAQAPYQERFMTANIRELRFVRLEDYYAPLKEIVTPETEPGYRGFKDNCVFCHSLKGIGGNKGAHWMSIYNFSREQDRIRFKNRFASVHGKDGPSKQYIEQFVTDKALAEIIRFLQDPRL